MARRRYQMPDVHKTIGKRKQWFIRYRIDVITGPGVTERRETTKYLGECASMGKREAEKLRDAFMQIVNRPDVVIPSQVPLSTVIQSYREAFIPGLKPNTQIGYLNKIEHHIEPHFGTMRLCDVRKEVVQAWIHTKSHLSPSSRKNLLAVLASIWERATEWDYTQSRNPAQGIRIGDDGGGRRRDTRSLTVEELRRLLGAADMREDRSELQAVVRLGAYCGLRIGEILGLRWGDVQPPVLLIRRSHSQREAICTEPKSARGRRIVPLPDGVLRRPIGAKGDADIFTYSYRALQYQLEASGASVGIKFGGFGFHSLRHTYATMMDAEGDPLQATMGHSSAGQSQAYVTRAMADTMARQRKMIGQVIGSGDVGRA